MAALRSFKRIGGPFRLLLLLLLQGLVEPKQLPSPKASLPIFKCSAKYFPSTTFDIVWMKDGKRIEPNRPQLFYKEENGRKEYRVTTNVSIPSGLGDVRSELSCQIEHKSDQKKEVLRDSQKHPVVLYISLFLTKVAILISIFCLFLIKVYGHKGTDEMTIPEHSRK